MKVSSLVLTNFRNYAKETVCLHPEINLFSGANAQGKTNLLESLFYLSTLRPLRPVREKELISFGKDCGEITARFDAFGREHCLSARIFTESRRMLFKNGVVQKKAADFAGTLQSVFFSPDDLALVKDGPALRRRMMDLALCQLRPRYGLLLAEYNKLLEQKGKILKQAEEKPSLAELLPVYNEKMAAAGGHLIAFRSAYAKLLAQHARALHNNISGGKDELSITYKTLSNIVDASLPANDLTALMRAHLESHGQAERAAKQCLSGPHKDDLHITINQIPAKAFASQGQIRTAVLSMKLAERDIFKKETGEVPVLLLDDVLSELDANRQNFVLNRIAGGQVLISCCSIDKAAAAAAGRQFSVSGGRVRFERDF